MSEPLTIERERADDELHALIDQSQEAVFLAQRSGQLLYVNDAACALSGYMRAALLKRPLDHMLALTWPKEGEEELNAAWRGGRLAPVATWLRRADGSWLTVEASALLLPGERVQIWAHDISSRDTQQQQRQRIAKLEHTLGANERLLKTIFDLLPVGVWIADRSGRVVGNNPAAAKIWNGARYVGIPDYCEYKGWWVETGEPVASGDWAMARAITQGETSTGELIRIQCFDGTFKTIIHSAAPLHGENGEVLGAIAVNEDITQLHEAQQKQRESEELLRIVFDLLPVGLWIADRDGTITFTNPAAEHIWSGLNFAGPAHDLAHQAWWVDTGEPVADEDWGLNRALRGETARGELIRMQCLDGSFKTIVKWAAPIRSGKDEIIGAIAASEDVTSLQYTQEQLRSAVREREQILAVVAHDLRNPLAALMAHAATAQLAAGRLPGGEKVAAQAASIADIVKRMSGLVNDLLAVGAAGADHHMLDLAAVSPASLLARAADAAKPLMAAKNLVLDVKPADGLPSLRADGDRILRVLGNLLENAEKFTEPQGRVSLAAYPAAAGILFTVSNSGPPVGAAELASMFEPFWQAGRDRRGAGLGLAICRSIVEAHGGTIWAEPADGQRLRVCFVLPRAQPDPASSAASAVRAA